MFTMTKTDSELNRSHLFTIRLWPELLDDGQVEWRGKVQHILSGEARYFRDWSTLITYMQEMLPAGDAPEMNTD